MQEKEVSIITDDKELEQAEYKDFKENAELKAIIAGQRAKKTTIKIGEIEVYITPSLKKGLRDKLIKIAKQYETEPEMADEEVYESLSQICLDPPYNKAAAWRYIDEETGMVPQIMMQIIEKITTVEGAAQRFRNQR